MARQVADHGTRARYCQGCRCSDCTRSNTVYQRGYRAGMSGPDLERYVDRAAGRHRAHTTSGRTVTWTEPELPL